VICEQDDEALVDIDGLADLDARQSASSAGVRRLRRSTFRLRTSRSALSTAPRASSSAARTGELRLRVDRSKATEFFEFPIWDLSRGGIIAAPPPLRRAFVGHLAFAVSAILGVEAQEQITHLRGQLVLLLLRELLFVRLRHWYLIDSFDRSRYPRPGSQRAGEDRLAASRDVFAELIERSAKAL
jgi:hypothetical protein